MKKSFSPGDFEVQNAQKLRKITLRELFFVINFVSEGTHPAPQNMKFIFFFPAGGGGGTEGGISGNLFFVCWGTFCFVFCSVSWSMGSRGLSDSVLTGQDLTNPR